VRASALSYQPTASAACPACSSRSP
jgi:hypothetical protein